MVKAGQAGVAEIFKTVGGKPPSGAAGGPMVSSPPDGSILVQLTADSIQVVGNKVTRAASAQKGWADVPRSVRAQLIEALSASVKQHRAELASLIMLEGGKTEKEALTEVDSSADILTKTVKDATLAEF